MRVETTIEIKVSKLYKEQDTDIQVWEATVPIPTFKGFRAMWKRIGLVKKVGKRSWLAQRNHSSKSWASDWATKKDAAAWLAGEFFSR